MFYPPRALALPVHLPPKIPYLEENLMKKHSILKKLTALAAAAALALSLCACAKSGGDHDTLPSPSGADGAEDGKTYKVAIIKQMDHASLDEIAEAVGSELEKLAKEETFQSAEFINIYYGEDVKEPEAQKTLKLFTKACPQAEINLLSGGQPVYYYMISAE